MAFRVVLVEVTVVDDWCGDDVVEDGSGDGDKGAVINNMLYFMCMQSSVQ